MDTVSKAVRSRIMSRVRGKDTKPELRLRRALHRAGYRYSLHKYFPEIRCRPDITMVSRRTVIFVDGCFWHKCPEHFRMPESNVEYWGPKLARNVERDREKDEWFEERGWSVIRVWEHDVLRLDEIPQKVENAIRSGP